MKANLPTPLLSAHIRHCHSGQDTVDIKDKGSHQRSCAPKSRHIAPTSLHSSDFRQTCQSVQEMLLKKLDTFVHIKFSNYRRATTTLLVLSVSPPPPLFVFIRLFGSISISSSPYLSTFHCLTLPLSPSVFPTKSIISNRFRTLIECRRHFSTGCKRRVLITENVFLLFCTIEPSSGPLARAKRSVCLCAFMCMFMSHVISQAPSITVKILLTVNADFYLCN